jgi:hypothetical protein
VLSLVEEILALVPLYFKRGVAGFHSSGILHRSGFVFQL